MIRWLFILIINSLCCGEAFVQPQENKPAPAQEQSLLILVDLQGALFHPKTANANFTSVKNAQVAEAIRSYKKQNAKILYLAEHSSEAMFWQNSIRKSNLPFEESFSLSNEIFHGFDGSMPTCRSGIVLCQSQPLGEILGLVINQLWVWTQFAPKKIIFYTVSRERGEIVSSIGLRIGALVNVNLVHGVVAPPPALNISKPSTEKSIFPKKLKKDKTPSNPAKSLGEILQKATIPHRETAPPEKNFPTITIDKSKLKYI
jgi:hypothetical protein